MTHNNVEKMYKRNQHQSREHTNVRTKRERKMNSLCERAFGKHIQYDFEEIILEDTEEGFTGSLLFH